jgi:hypothetical protein
MVIGVGLEPAWNVTFSDIIFCPPTQRNFSEHPINLLPGAE